MSESSHPIRMSPAVIAIADWLIEQGLAAPELEPVLDGLCARMAASGVPLLRGHASVSTIHPSVSSFGGTWWRTRDAQRLRFQHEDQSLDRWQLSPFRAMIERNQMRLRKRLVGPEAELDFPVLEELRDQGGTDWLAHMVPFGDWSRGDVPIGAVLSWVSDAPEGFSPEDEAVIDWLVPRFGMVAYRVVSEQVAVNVLDAYVGQDAGRRILRGQVRRGAAEGLAAAILFADLRGFTAMADATPGDRLMAGLNEYLGSVTDAVEARGGQVLKFLGDGLLAVFSLEGRETPAVCADALAAAEDALAANAAINLRRRRAGEPALELEIALHMGEVLYGNVGSARRLDFTVIGPAVNEASRIEALCGELGEPLLLSGSFARASGQPVRSLGRHSLRGVSAQAELFTIERDGEGR